MVWPCWMDFVKSCPFFLCFVSSSPFPQHPEASSPVPYLGATWFFWFWFCQIFIVINFTYSSIQIVVANVFSLSRYVSLLRRSYISMYDMFNQILLTLAILFHTIEIRRKGISVFPTFLKCFFGSFLSIAFLTIYLEPHVSHLPNQTYTDTLSLSYYSD